MANDILQRATAYWAGKRRAGRLPVRRDIDLAEAADLAPYVVLSTRPDGPGAYDHHHAGAKAEALLGGRIVSVPGNDEVAGDLLGAWLGGLDIACRSSAPHAATMAPGDDENALTVVYLPMLQNADDEHVRWVMSVIARSEG